MQENEKQQRAMAQAAAAQHKSLGISHSSKKIWRWLCRDGQGAAISKVPAAAAAGAHQRCASGLMLLQDQEACKVRKAPPHTRGLAAAAEAARREGLLPWYSTASARDLELLRSSADMRVLCKRASENKFAGGFQTF